MERVMKHSDGMISVDVSGLLPLQKAIEFVKGTKLYAELVELTGAIHADHSVAGVFVDVDCEFCKKLWGKNN